MAPFLLPLTHFSIELFLDLKLCVLGNKWKVDISQKLWAIKKEVIHFFSHQQLFAFAKHSQSRSLSYYYQGIPLISQLLTSL